MHYPVFAVKLGSAGVSRPVRKKPKSLSPVRIWGRNLTFFIHVTDCPDIVENTPFISLRTETIRPFSRISIFRVASLGPGSMHVDQMPFVLLLPGEDTECLSEGDIDRERRTVVQVSRACPEVGFHFSDLEDSIQGRAASVGIFRVRRPGIIDNTLQFLCVGKAPVRVSRILQSLGEG